MNILSVITDHLVKELQPLRFRRPVAYVYNPLEYARKAYDAYVERYGGRREILLVGMNPGPYGMAQTGVPFGDVGMVRGWLGIEAPVGAPARQHPKRPVLGFHCPRREVSGQRLWGWAKERFGEPRHFFARFFVANYCPLVFMEESGRNRTPDKLPVNEKERLFSLCDRALVESVRVISPSLVIGVGRFTTSRLEAALSDQQVRIGMISHPSPANPKANRGWAATVEEELSEMGVKL
jgi:single-strand selective monofunctional uracil DNA glycosylase